MNDELRKLDEAADESLSCGPFYTAIAAGMNAATAEYYAAASPDVVLRLMDRIAELERQRDAWIESARQFHGGEQYYRGLIDSVAPALGPAMYTQDDGGVVPEPLRACLPKAVAALVAERDEAREAVRRLARALDGMLAGHRECDVTAIEVLHTSVVRRIAEGG